MFRYQPTRLGLAQEELRAAMRCVAILICVVAFGTLGFWFVEGENDWDLWRCLFFTLITITTVGYGDEGLSPNGEIFAAVLLIFGIGTATYSITSLVQIAVNYQSMWKRRMQDKIDLLQGHYIICGFGRIGRTIAAELQTAGKPFVVVDRDADVIEQAIEQDYLALRGNSTEESTLQQAGIARAKGLICVTSSDAENVFVTLCANELNPDVFIASRSSTESAGRKMERAGASVVVSPYTTAGNRIIDAIMRPKLSKFLSKTDGEFNLGELTVGANDGFDGRSIKSIGQQFPEIVFVAHRRDMKDKPTRPGGDTTLQSGDWIAVAGPRDELESLYSAAHNEATTYAMSLA